MKEELKLIQYAGNPGKKFDLGFMSLENAKRVQRFHASFPMYRETPLTELKETAGAVTGFFASVYGEDRPVITIVEPNKADCVFRTAEAADGKLHFVTGEMNTIMARLACGEPCSIGWNVLRDYADNFISCLDYMAAQGMRILGSPVQGDPRVVSGESGAAAFGCVSEIMRDPKYADVRKKLGLNQDSRVLFFSTEGDTDQENYRSIVWDGAYPGDSKR